MRFVVPKLIVLCLGFGCCVRADAAERTEQLIGLWEADLSQAVVEGRLTIDARATPWHASIAGFDMVVKREGDDVLFSLPGNQGSFRGRVESGRLSRQGFWIQPPGEIYNRAYATPLRLEPLQKDVWTAEVRPLREPSRLYLQIQRGIDGALTAFVRNPEFNLARERAYSVQVDADTLTLLDAKHADWRQQATFDTKSGTLRASWQDLGQLIFARRDRDQAAGFYPRVPSANSYAYRQPIVDGDGWATASLSGSGFDEQKIAALVEHVANDTNAGHGAAQVQALLIARHGKLVLEQYFHGFDRDRPHDTRSAGKTFAAMMVGLAGEHGKPLAADAPIAAMLPQYRGPANADARKHSITLANLMTMTSGLSCDDNDDDSPGNEDVMQSQEKQNDWYRYTLDLPMARDPGGDKAVYCSAGVNLLGAIVAHASGMWLPRFFATYIAGPLQMRDYHINLMPDGDAYLGGGIYLRPRDFLKLGQVYLDAGRWNGRRVIEQTWVDASTARHSQFDDHAYGYGWHLYEVKVASRLVRSYVAGGNGGQFVVVVPDIDLAVAITAGNYGDFKTWYPLRGLVETFIAPAITR